MKIKHGMILAAGIGKRMQPLTLKKPKPLIEINNLSLLERAINLLIGFGVQEISINVHYLAKQIENFINEKNFNVKINISNEVDLLLDTGGGVLEGTKHFDENPFIVINPDTLWNKKYLEELRNLEEIHFKNNKPCLLLVDKASSYDTSFTGDFNLEKNQILKGKENQFIFTGIHITSRNFLVSENSKVFSMNNIWNNLIDTKALLGLESKQKFYHLNTFEMYNKISKLKIID
jgi:N-acetyl-alpha-D-muramate 1-phosphate uridylyltransferase